MQEKLEKTKFRALVLLLAAVALPAGAVTLGEAQVRSALGEPLDVRIPVTMAGGESIERSCFAMLSQNDAGLPGVGEGSVSIERTRGAAALRLRTFAPVREPAVAMKVRAACPNASEPPFVREYVLLLDPPVTALRPSSEAAAAQRQVPARGILATILARIGDTLESLARAIVPDHRNARRDYIAAMRASNPSLQSLSDSDPIPEGTAVALPDMRLASRLGTPARAPAENVAAKAPRPPREAAPKPRPAAREGAAPRAGTARSAAPADAAPPSRRAEPARRDAGFVLKLSNPDIDMSRTARIDEPGRQRLRERQLILDADDQVSALLAMRNSLKQLETRVAELQLKLAAMPPALATMTPPERPAKAVVPEQVPAPPKAAATQPPVPPVVEPPKPVVEAPKAVVEPPQVVAPAPKPDTEPAPPAAPVASAPINPPTVPEAAAPVKPQAESTPERKPASKVVARQPGSSYDTMPWLWALVALLAALALWLALRITRRRRVEGEDAPATEYLEPEMGTPEAVEAAVIREPAVAAARPEERPALASDAPLATRFAENSGELRRRYIEERFPEIASGAIRLEDSDSVVKGARLLYEDGVLPRAVELLQFAVEDRPAEMKPWLALFEIFRLESLTGQYAELATRFQKVHGSSDYWRKVKFFGREIDRGNALYKEDAVSTLETIGPREARRLATANAPVDPIAENWLAAPMDFENEVLANDLRRSLLAQAKLTDQDLQPNPMPALRNVEMFTVA